MYVEGVNKAATAKEEKPEGNFEDARSGQSFAVQSDEHLVKAIGKERRTDPGSLLRAAPRLLGDPDVLARPMLEQRRDIVKVAPLSAVTA